MFTTDLMEMAFEEVFNTVEKFFSVSSQPGSARLPMTLQTVSQINFIIEKTLLELEETYGRPKIFGKCGIITETNELRIVLYTQEQLDLATEEADEAIEGSRENGEIPPMFHHSHGNTYRIDYSSPLEEDSDTGYNGFRLTAVVSTNKEDIVT